MARGETIEGARSTKGDDSRSRDVGQEGREGVAASTESTGSKAGTAFTTSAKAGFEHCGAGEAAVVGQADSFNNIVASGDVTGSEPTADSADSGECGLAKTRQINSASEPGVATDV